MMRIYALLALGLIGASCWGAPSPYPVTIDSRYQTMPKLTVYRASQVQFALTFTDGATRNSLVGQTVWMSWSTSTLATACSTATVAIVTATNGTATATFSASAMNYAPGRYVYEVGTTSNAVVSVFRQGVLEIVGSPYATGAGSVSWTTNFPWALISATPTTLAGYGITDALTSTNAIPTSGTLDGTNGVYWTRNTTNYWLLFP